MTAPHVDVRVATHADPSPPLLWESLPEEARSVLNDRDWSLICVLATEAWRRVSDDPFGYTAKSEKTRMLFRLIEAIERCTPADVERLTRYKGHGDAHAFDKAPPSRWELWVHERAVRVGGAA
jgi:hypothetical protein